MPCISYTRCLAKVPYDAEGCGQNRNFPQLLPCPGARLSLREGWDKTSRRLLVPPRWPGTACLTGEAQGTCVLQWHELLCSSGAMSETSTGHPGPGLSGGLQEELVAHPAQFAQKRSMASVRSKAARQVLLL